MKNMQTNTFNRYRELKNMRRQVENNPDGSLDMLSFSMTINKLAMIREEMKRVTSAILINNPRHIWIQ